MEIVLFGGEADVHATIARFANAGEATVRTKSRTFEGTYSDYEPRLQVLLAGRTAEEIVLGEASHGAGGGRGSDLHRATSLATAMLGSFGIAGPTPLLFLAPHEDTDELLSYADVRTTVHAELLKAAEGCRSTLSNHRAALDEIVTRLLRDTHIDGTATAAIIDSRRKARNARQRRRKNFRRCAGSRR
jgi:cell division protease FtsH